MIDRCRRRCTCRGSYSRIHSHSHSHSHSDRFAKFHPRGADRGVGSHRAGTRAQQLLHMLTCFCIHGQLHVWGGAQGRPLVRRFAVAGEGPCCFLQKLFFMCRYNDTYSCECVFTQRAWCAHRHRHRRRHRHRHRCRRMMTWHARFMPSKSGGIGPQASCHTSSTCTTTNSLQHISLTKKVF